MRRWLVIISVLPLLVSCAFGQSMRQTTGTIQGVVFTLDSKGERTVIPGAQISVADSRHMETKSEGDGLFAFGAVPAGNYKITATAPGMATAQSIVVVATSEVNLEMKLATVKQTVTVTASAEPPEPDDPPATNHIGGSTVVDAPNADERFESLLPFC